MCLAIPGKILNITSEAEDFMRTGKVSFGGIVKEVNLAYVPEAQIGDYVIVHVGFAISTLDQAEADIEDIMHPDFFCAIINQTYDLKGEHQLDAAKLAAAEATPRQVKQAEAHFRVLTEEIPEYSHYRPADWLIRNSNVLDGDTTEVTETLEKAEKVIAVYNAILS